MTTTMALEETIRAFIAEATGVAGTTIRDDTPLLASGLLTSLQAIDLVAHVEAVTGVMVDVTRLRPGTFRDIRALADGLRETQGPAPPPTTRAPERGSSGATSSPTSAAAIDLMCRVDAAITQAAGCPDERHSPLVELDVLRRIGWIASFPQLLTLASTLRRDDAVMRRAASHPVEAADLAEPACALTPAACIPALAARAGSRLQGPMTLTTLATCFRHEAQTEPGVRLRAFSMREVVCIGAPDEARAFRETWSMRGRALATALGLDVQLIVASDPFFDPAHDPLAFAQRMDEPIKLELVHDGVALASFNLHRGFFARAHDITMEGAPCWSACAAFGLERWAWALGQLGAEPDWAAAQALP